MTSLLSFAWRKAASPAHSNSTMHSMQEGSADQEQPDHLLPHPSVSASSSGETLTNPPCDDPLFDPRRPSTPQALRGRKTADEIRQELGLTKKRLVWQESLPASACISSACPSLPTMGCGSMPSPQPSTSSFYSRTSRDSRYVASSPNLKVGQAKTAVGALVALAGTGANSLQGSEEQITDSQHQKRSILPSRDWLEDNRTIKEANDFSVELPYEPLNESRGSFAPLLETGPFPMQESPSDDESSIHDSPNRDHANWQRQQHPDTSFTRGFLQANTSHLSHEQYDFHPIVDQELVVPEHPALPNNMSGISHSTREIESLQSLADDLVTDGSSFKKKVHLKEQRLRAYNESRIMEDLLLSTLERLQDDPDLVLEVLESTEGSSGMGKALRNGHGNLFTGFERQQRETIIKNMDITLKDFRAAASDDSSTDNPQARDQLVQALSFVRSLVHMSIPSSEKSAKNQDSSEGFPQHQHRWRRVPGLRQALGFDEEPKSPETVRGGDTSLFSLPSDSANDMTPHTSNVSMTSTITSVVSPEKNNRTSGFFPRRNIRRSMEVLLTEFEALGDVCCQLEGKTAISAHRQAARAIKRIYLQLCTVSQETLKSVIDAFELDFMPLTLSRLVSQDQGDKPLAENRHQPASQNKFQTIPSIKYNVTSDRLVSQKMALPLESLEANLVEDDENCEHLFSPTTADMRSLEQSTVSPDDDLRRTAGSFDLDEVEEEREAPPPEVASVPQQPLERKNRVKRNFFKRIQTRKRQCAE